LIPFVNHHVQIIGYETWCVECGGVVPQDIVILDDENFTMDINGDGDVNVIDILQNVNCILMVATCENCMDVNEDGEVNVLDIIELINYILSPLDLPDQCYKEIGIGPCEAWIPVYQFNIDIGECEITYYGGCSGNVPFWTEEECENLCE